MHDVNIFTIFVSLLLVTFSDSATAFSIGAVRGLNCSTGNKETPPCSVAKLLIQYETVHQNITQNALSNIDYTPPGSSIPIGGFTSGIIIEIQNSNRNVDRDQDTTKLHFDNENFNGGLNRLIDLEIDILNKLQEKTTIDTSDAAELRSKLGQYFHTLQDFFSHSSWVNTHTTSQDVPKFWTFSRNILPLATSTPCPNNTSTLGLNSFTSGYAIRPLDSATAPTGKCAHGLIGVFNPNIVDVLNPGIHKDWMGRDLHPQARAQAIYATVEATKYIINDPDNNPDNVCMLMTNSICPKSIDGQWFAFEYNGKNLPISWEQNIYEFQSDILTFSNGKPCQKNNQTQSLICGKYSDSVLVVMYSDTPIFASSYCSNSDICSYTYDFNTNKLILYNKYGVASFEGDLSNDEYNNEHIIIYGTGYLYINNTNTGFLKFRRQ